MSMDLKVDAGDLTTLLSCAKLYLDEATIRVANGKATIMEVDPTHTQMMCGSIDCQSEDCEIPVNLEKLIKALSAAGQGAVIELDDGFIRIHGAHTRIKIPLIYRDVNFKWPAKFSGQPIAECDLPPSILAPVISYGQYTSSAAAKFTIGDTRMTIEIGQEPDVSEIVCPNTAVGESTVTVDLTYLDTIIKHVKNLPTVKVCGYGDNVPIQFMWTAGTGVFKVMVAPRIEGDEN